MNIFIWWVPISLPSSNKGPLFSSFTLSPSGKDKETHPWAEKGDSQASLANQSLPGPSLVPGEGVRPT